MASVCFAQRKFVEAEEHFRTVLELEPDVSAHHRNLGGLYSTLDRREEAERELRQALELAPDDPDNLVALGRLELDRGKAGEAERFAHEALTLAPRHQDALVLMGRVLLRRGDVDAAREHALWAVSIDPSDRGALGLLASIKAKTNWFLGIWWRANTWLLEAGTRNAVLLLLGAFVLYRVLTQVLVDFERDQAAELVSFAWMGICIYSWVGPGMFRRELQKELQSIRLRKDF
jgi:tetratricopeptide (TPR) repeat protein